jgi:hypothetical protein
MDANGVCWSDGGGGSGGGGGQTPPEGGGGSGGKTLEDELLEEFEGPIVGAVMCLLSIGVIGMEVRGVARAFEAIRSTGNLLREAERVLDMLNQQPNPDHTAIVNQQNHVEILRANHQGAISNLADRVDSSYVNSMVAVVACGAAFVVPLP